MLYILYLSSYGIKVHAYYFDLLIDQYECTIISYILISDKYSSTIEDSEYFTSFL